MLIIAPTICTSDVTSVGIFTCSNESIELEKSIPTLNMDISKCASYISISSEVIIDDKNDVNYVANGQRVLDATVCVDFAIVHTTQSDLVTTEIYVEPPLLYPNFLSTYWSRSLFSLVDIDPSQCYKKLFSIVGFNIFCVIE